MVTLWSPLPYSATSTSQQPVVFFLLLLFFFFTTHPVVFVIFCHNANHILHFFSWYFSYNLVSILFCFKIMCVFLAFFIPLIQCASIFFNIDQITGTPHSSLTWRRERWASSYKHRSESGPSVGVLVLHCCADPAAVCTVPLYHRLRSSETICRN